MLSSGVNCPGCKQGLGEVPLLAVRACEVHCLELMRADSCGGCMVCREAGHPGRLEVASSLDSTTKLATGILCFLWSLCFLMQSRMIALHLGLVMTQSGKIISKSFEQVACIVQMSVIKMWVQARNLDGNGVTVENLNSLCALLPRMTGINRNLLAAEKDCYC